MSIFKRLFGGDSKDQLDPRSLVESAAKELVAKAGFQLDVTVTQESQGDQNSISVDFFGEDEKLLCDRDGQYLEAIQIFLKRVLQHRLPEDRTPISVDAGGFSENNQRELERLADKLRQSVLSRKRPVYCRALRPRERKIIHQYLSTDQRIKTKSVGEGTYKKIKVYLADAPEHESSSQ